MSATEWDSSIMLPKRLTFLKSLKRHKKTGKENGEHVSEFFS